LGLGARAHRLAGRTHSDAGRGEPTHMAQAVAGHSAHPPTSTGTDNRKLLMWFVLGSECLFFGSLIAPFLIFKGDSLVGPYPHPHNGEEGILDIPVTSTS